MPTPAGIATAVIGGALLIIARVFGIFELYIVAAAMLALVFCSVAWVLLNRRSLKVQRIVEPARLHVGGDSVVTLTLTNDWPIPSPVAQITDEVEGTPRADAHVAPLTRRSEAKASYRVPAETRGRIALGPMRTRVTDPFSLASTVRSSAPDASVLVLPAYWPITPPPLPSGSVAARPDRNPGRIGPTGDEFSSLRSYVVGDDLRKVHWPSTARSGELVVRTEHVPEHGDSVVVLDVRRDAADPDTFELMVSAATSIVLACAERGDSVRLLTTEGVDLCNDEVGTDGLVDHLAMVVQHDLRQAILPADDRPAELAVLVVGSDEGVTELISTHRSIPGTATVVRCVTPGARPTTKDGALPSRRMAIVSDGAEFVALWPSLISNGGSLS